MYGISRQILDLWKFLEKLIKKKWQEKNIYLIYLNMQEMPKLMIHFNLVQVFVVKSTTILLAFRLLRDFVLILEKLFKCRFYFPFQANCSKEENCLIIRKWNKTVPYKLAEDLCEYVSCYYRNHLKVYTSEPMRICLEKKEK